MRRQTSLSKNKTKLFRDIPFGAMCLLTLLCIATAVKYDIFRDSYLCVMNILKILGLIFLTMLSGLLLFREGETAGPMRYFILFLLNVHFAVSFSTLATSLYLTPDHARRITALCTVCYFFTVLLFLTLWLYQKQFLEESALTKAVTVLVVLVIVAYTGALAVNLFRPVMFRITEEGTMSEDEADYISVIFDFIFLMLLSVATLFSNLNLSRKLSFISCIFVPVLFVMLSLNQYLLRANFTLWAVVIITVVLPLSLLFFNAHDRLESDAERRKKEQKQLQISAMISQMQPHFLSNSLAVIAALCEEDPKLAAEAANAFSNYLRENMVFADKSEPISFSEELNHIKTYVWLEKLRFQNKLSVEYDVNCTAFPVPALSVQPMVENAIKHGVCKSKSGGTVRICSSETERCYLVTVSDDGVGFDVPKTIDDGKRHLGIKNTSYRIREMVGGSLEIVSAPGKGTTVSITVPK